MSLSALAASAMSLLLPYVSKGGEEFAKEAGKAAFEKAKGLMAEVRSWFEKSDDSKEVLNNFEKKPQIYRPTFEALLKSALNNDPAFRSKISEMLEAAKPELKAVQVMLEGENVVGNEVDHLAEGKVTAKQKIDKAKGVTGNIVKTMGRPQRPGSV